MHQTIQIYLSTGYSQVTHILGYYLIFNKKVAFNELLIVENSLPMPPNNINAVIEWNIVIRNLREYEYSNY